jgi:hypothetical protein
MVAAEPKISRLDPPGGQRGTDREVIVGGERLGDAIGALFYEPGITLKSIQVQPDKRVKLLLQIAADCRPGPHALRLQTASGISNLMTFSVGALPEVARIEANKEKKIAGNHDFDHPQKIPLGCVVTGVIEKETVDYYAVEAKKGQRLSVEVEGLRLGLFFFDPAVSVMDMRRFVLASADDTPLMQQDCACSVVVPQDGTYFVQVRESAFGGSDQCVYRLHVGTFPRPMAVFPVGGKPGETLDVRWLGDGIGPWTQKITLPASVTPDFGLFAQDGGGIAPTANPFRISPLNNVFEAEPNDKPEQATSFTAPAALNGLIVQPGDVDCFVFPANKGQVYDVRVFARSLRTPLDSVLRISKLGGGELAYNDDSGGPDSYIRFNVPEDGRYVISITDQMGRGGENFVYRIEVTPVEPKLVFSLPERSQYNDVVAGVPSGNRMALVVDARREDFGGDVALELRELPPGLSWQAEPIPSDRGNTLLLLTAAGGAKPAAGLVDIVGRHKEGDRTIEGHLYQLTSLIRGDNNREVWAYHGHRLAAGVNEPVPFHIEIVPPKVPLVRNGNMELKVKVNRDNNFKEPVTLRMLNLPSGVSTTDAVTVPGDKSEGSIPLTAAGDAGVRIWKIATIGEWNRDGGQVLVSSQLADLEVAEPRLNFSIQSASVDQGKKGSVLVKVEKGPKFAGTAVVELLGLPNEVTTEKREFHGDTAELIFPVATTANSPVGVHRTLVVRGMIVEQGEPIVQVAGGGELRIQQPPPPKPASVAKVEPQVAAKPAAPVQQPSKAPPKPLSRLEQLRLQNEQK